MASFLPTITVSDVFSGAADFVNAYLPVFLAMLGIPLGVYIWKQVKRAVKASR